MKPVGRPRYSFVIPVWHEEEMAPAVVARVRALDADGRCEVIVVDGDPEGSTLRVLEDPEAIRVTAPRGRGPQMNAGAERAHGDVLVFLHADTRVPLTMLSDIDEVLAGGASCGAFRLRFDSGRRIYRFMAAWVSYMTRIARLPYGDQAIFVTRELFERIGGYRPVPVMEDVDLVRRIRRNGVRLRMARSAVVTSIRRMEGEGIVHCVTRNTCIRILFTLGVSPHVLARWYTDDHRLGAADRVVLAGPGDRP